MAKKPIKKDKQEANIEDQIDNEILNQETVGDLKSNNNILKYSYDYNFLVNMRWNNYTFF